jgi:hypothetical protein
MTYSQVSPRVVVPFIGFTAAIGNASTDLRAHSAAASRPGARRETEDRSSPDVIEYLAIAFVALAVAFGPAVVALL